MEKRGLSSEEAVLLQQQFGLNQLPAPTPTRWWRKLLQQFNNTLIFILSIAAIFSVALSHWVDGGIIVAVILVNTVLGFIQENRAEKAVAALQSYLVEYSLVLRDGDWQKLPSTNLLPGDWVRIENGERIAADLHIREAYQLQVDESLLTGESVPVDKHLSNDNVQGILHAGTMVTRGSGVGEVFATGAATSIGHIQKLLAQTKPSQSPLLIRINRLSRWLGLGVFILAIIASLIAWMHDDSLEFAILAAISLAVAIIPEGLPAVISITLALGVQRMAQKGSIIRQLPAVETLGAVTVICTDKTGTLTENRMAVEDLRLAQENSESLHRALENMLLCNDAEISDAGQSSGDPLEQALIDYAYDADSALIHYQKRNRRLDTRPFDHESPYMATLHADRIAIKGAPEFVLQHCLQEQEQTDSFWQGVISEMANLGLRTIALAEADISRWSSLDQGRWRWLGVVALLDPPRQAVPAAIAACRGAGIRVIMVTGDHPRTAATIARQIGLVEAGSVRVVDHAQWLAASPAERQQLAREVNVFARVQPADKLELVETLQNNGEIVAMTGDGVNDAPALRRAQIGVAMGLSGSTVAREAAAMILTDDDFAHIASAVAEGRHIYNNIQRTVLFMLPTNFAQGMVIFIAVIFRMNLPITPLQILWINTVTAITLALVFAFMGADKALMQQLPRPVAQPLVPGILWRRITLVTIFLLLMVFAIFEAGSTFYDVVHARTLAVNGLMAMEGAVLLAMYGAWRNDRGDWILIGSLGAMILLQVLFSQLTFLQLVFQTTSMSLIDIGIIFFTALLAWLAARLIMHPQQMFTFKS
ncbi:cation-translocating P-type ATPase [Acidithiobacillus concretivorus]|uniref:HAD-IC family P-type ATPase n=1 Tax=Acidithiobacillus concretivorus TaxID=3063952 RepID=A0ABS5ZT18_9PROT|nr:HAD-IC family P-type ATPase [Acidithiobacillus concretivorus]MBU2739545.1 HAD-IC family P-type ATPase [Acidithiobacillus concretivorus]